MAKVQRQLPHPTEIFDLIKFKKLDLNLKRARLSDAQTIDDLRKIAKRRTPAAAFDYTDGAADDEISMNRARQAFKDVEFHPSILNDVSNVDTSCEVFGGPSALPFGIAPTGFTRLMQTEGELAGASAAGKAGIPFCLSTLGTTSIEDVKAANPHGRNFFQLYVMRQREISYGLVKRAAAAGFDTLFFTVDTPIAGARLRDKRNGFSIPPQISLGTVANAIPRPWWWVDFLTTPTLSFASLSSTGGTVGELLNSAMDPSIQFSDLEEIRSMWPGKLVVKGVQNVEDSKKLADLGVDGIILSNHGYGHYARRRYCGRHGHGGQVHFHWPRLPVWAHGWWGGRRDPGDRNPGGAGSPHHAVVAGRDHRRAVPQACDAADPPDAAHPGP